MSNKKPYALHKKCIYKHGYTYNKNTLLYGNYGFMAIEEGLLKTNQIEATRIAMNKHIKKMGILWIRVKPYLPLSKKPLEVRMGKGKGPFNEWIYYVQRNEIIFEINNIPEDSVRRAFHVANVKFPLHLKLVKLK
jgi:large subunit ribosomal protein L16